MFGWKKKKQKESKPDLNDFKTKLEISNKNIDLNKLSLEIETFLKKSDDPFDYAEYSIHEFPEDKLKVFKIEYGIKSPTTKFLVVIEGDSNNLKISDHLSRNYATYAEILLISHVLFLPKLVNAKVYHVKLWQHIEETVQSLEY